MFASSRVRELERRSASACAFDTSVLNVSKAPDGGWGGSAGVDSESCAEGGSAAAAVPFTQLDLGTTIRVAPMERARGGWDDEHFHDRLRIPEGSSAGRGLVVTLEGTRGAMGRKGTIVPKISMN